MEELSELLRQMITEEPVKIVISKPVNKQVPYHRVVIEKKAEYYQIARYTEKQVFHVNVDAERLFDEVLEYMSKDYQCLNAWTSSHEFSVTISKKRKVFSKIKGLTEATESAVSEHNRRKNYLLPEGEIIEPLVDMGVFTKEGKIVRTMYDKYKQINRFVEIVDDAVKKQNRTSLNIIDFGCGKSYLTFILYYYLTEIRHLSVNIIGLDLKEDVIRHCNEAASKYHYDNLHFELGDIHGFQSPFPVNMVVTLHACDTATDFALYNAIQWGADMIFSVPCCQHELNGQIQTEEFALFTRYGLLTERFCALATDAIRGNLLEYMGYNTQLLEFVDFEHTPKNLLIRAVRNDKKSKAVREKAMQEVLKVTETYRFNPTLLKLLQDYEKR